MTDILHGLGAWWNGLGPIDDDLPREVARAQAAKLDYVVIKYGYPDVEQAFHAVGILWGTEMFVERGAVPQTAMNLGNAVDAGAAFVVLNAEEGGGWDASPGAGSDMALLIGLIKDRHPGIPLYGCIDTRGGRTTYPYEVALLQHADAIASMAYVLDFYPSRPAGYVHSGVGDALAPLLGTSIGQLGKVHPVLQAYGGIGANDLLQEVREAAAYRPASLSFYTVGHATDDEWQQLVNLRHLMEMQSPGQTLAAVGGAFHRVADAIAAGQAASSIAEGDRQVVKYIAGLLP